MCSSDLRAGHPVPMDIEWARDGIDGQLYLVQARPETVASRRSATELDEYRLEAKGQVLASGRAVGEHRFGALPRGHRVAFEVNELAQPLANRPGHLELSYDFTAGRDADGWLHALFRMEDRLSGHVAETGRTTPVPTEAPTSMPR